MPLPFHIVLHDVVVIATIKPSYVGDLLTPPVIAPGPVVRPDYPDAATELARVDSFNGP